MRDVRLLVLLLAASISGCALIAGLHDYSLVGHGGGGAAGAGGAPGLGGGGGQ